MQPWLYLVCALLACAYALLWSRLRRARALLAGLPSYPRLPLIGNLLQVAGDGSSIFRLLEDMSQKAEDAMKPFQLWFGSFPIILISDPDDVKAVTHAFIEKPYYYNFGKPWLGDGLVTAPGAIWKQDIKKLANAFNATVVEGYQMTFNAQAQKLVRNLKKEVGGKPFDFMHQLTYTTLEAICQTALGTAHISDVIVTEEYYNAFGRCLELLISRGLNLMMHPDCLYRLTPAYKEFKRCVAVLHNVSDKVLKKRRLERETIKEKDAASGTTDQERKFKALLDILLDLSETDPRLTEEHIRHQIDTIIVGGQETVASTLLYSLLMIGCKPRVQEKLYNEIQAIFGGSLRPVVKADLQRMQYCEAVLSESLRLFPPVPVVMRYSDRELQLKTCRVPKGTGCGINAWGAGRSKRLWGPDALEYDPERWLDGRVPSNSAAFLPFSYGRRACIGKKYAFPILKTILAHCVRELKFTSESDKLELKIDLTLKPVSGHLIQVTLRN